MNIYEKLLSYLNNELSKITEQTKLIEQNNLIIKEKINFVDICIQLINDKRISEIDFEKLRYNLKDMISEEEIDKLIEKINDLVVLLPFLYDDRVALVLGGIKESALKDLDLLKKQFSRIKEYLQKQEISKETLDKVNTIKKYIDCIDVLGFKNSICDVNNEFVLFLRNSNLDNEDILVLVYEYYKCCLKFKKNGEVYNNSYIDNITINAEKVTSELERKEVVEPEEKEVLEEKIEPKTPKISELSEQVSELNEKEKEIYDKILYLVEQNQKNINDTTYEIYKKYYSNLDILSIFSSRSDFFDANGVDWERFIPCLDTKLVPNINSEDKTLIFNIFSCIIALHEEQLNKKQKEVIKNEITSQKLLKFKEELIKICEDSKEIKDKYNDLTEEIAIKIKKSNCEEELLNIAEGIKSGNLDVNDEYLAYFELSRLELKFFIEFKTIFEDLDFIRNYFSLEITQEEFEEISEMLVSVKKIVTEFDSRYDNLFQDDFEIIDEFEEIEDENTEIINTSVKQYEFGKNIIVFFRENETCKFIIEDDLANVNNPKESLSYVEKILKTLNDYEHWHFREKKFMNFAQDVKESAHSQKPYIIISNYSGERCEFSRLKAPLTKKGENNRTRVSCIKINMCQENMKKLKLSTNNVMLVINAIKIRNQNSKNEYSYFRGYYEKNTKEIQRIIELFENPNTPVEELYKLLNDSNDLYQIYRNKGKGKGD